MRKTSLTLLTSAGVLFLGSAPAHAGPIGGPSGQITFEAVAALPVPVGGPLGLAVLVLALAGLGLIALRRRVRVNQLLAIGVPIVGACALAGAMVAMPKLTAQMIPDFFQVDGPSTVAFDFPPTADQLGAFNAVEFRNVGRAPLEITALETSCGTFEDFRPVVQGDRVEMPVCEVGDELAPETICRVDPPECEVIDEPVG
ncbi:MAG: midcut-by-XrtH protein [Wenzhouxiangella sp.]